jgi:sugar phosphate isomerase/epimerase
MSCYTSGIAQIRGKLFLDKMFYGAPAASVKEIENLRSQGFHFAEVAMPNAAARRMWESGVKNISSDTFFVVAHGPLEDSYSDDARYLWSHYLPNLVATVDTAQRMRIEFLTIHMSMDRKLVADLYLAEKMRALKELVEYAHRNDVVMGLENVTEDASDMEAVLNEVPGLCLTLDVGHAQLGSEVNKSFEIIERCGPTIRHLHLHDNRGGAGQAADLHLPVGDGVIDFRGILSELFGSGYDGTMTLEMKPRGLAYSRNIVQKLIEVVVNAKGRRLEPWDDDLS